MSIEHLAVCGQCERREPASVLASTISYSYPSGSGVPISSMPAITYDYPEGWLSVKDSQRTVTLCSWECVAAYAQKKQVAW